MYICLCTSFGVRLHDCMCASICVVYVYSPSLSFICTSSTVCKIASRMRRHTTLAQAPAFTQVSQCSTRLFLSTTSPTHHLRRARTRRASTRHLRARTHLHRPPPLPLGHLWIKLENPSRETGRRVWEEAIAPTIVDGQGPPTFGLWGQRMIHG